MIFCICKFCRITITSNILHCSWSQTLYVFGYKGCTHLLWVRSCIGCCFVFFGQGSKVWLSLVSDSCLYCHDKMAPALHCDVCVCVSNVARQAKLCVCAINVFLLVCVSVLYNECEWVCMCVCCRLSLFQLAPYSSNPLIPIIPLSPSSLFFLLPPPLFLQFPSCLPLLSYLCTSLCLSSIS